MKVTIIASALVGILALSACGASGGAASVETAESSVETTEAESTPIPTVTAKPAPTLPPTTTAAPTTTEAPKPTASGVVWGSMVDASRVNTLSPAPVWQAGATTVSVDMAGIVNNDTSTEMGSFCYNAVDWAEVEADTCLYVQIRFNVAADAIEEAYVYVTDVVTAEGTQIETYEGSSGRPGTVDNVIQVMIPNGGPGTRLFLDIDAGMADYQRNLNDIEFIVPGPEAFLPIAWMD